MAEVLAFPGFIRTPVDDTEDRARALNTRTSCIVEAPAGSGKTGLLVQRYLKLLGDSEAVEMPEEVLAVTFTRKATAELQERVLRELHAAGAGVALAEDAKPFDRETRGFAEGVMARGWDLLHEPHRLNIRSLDAVCAGIAQALPLLSGSGGAHQPVEDASSLYRQAARRTLLQLGGKDRNLHRALYELLLHRDGNLRDCEALLAEMLGRREQWGELVPLAPGALEGDVLDLEVRPRLEATLESVVCGSLTRLLKAVPSHLLEELTELGALLAVAPGYQGMPSPIAVCAGRSISPEDKAEHLDHWTALISLLLTKEGWRKPGGLTSRFLGFELSPLHKPRLVALIEAIQNDPLLDLLRDVRKLPPATYPDDQWRIARTLFRVLGHALIELKLLFAETGECDFTELALNARLALDREFEAGTDTSATGAALTSGSRLRHLLVDEMQDTSSAQYALLEQLTRSWDGHSQTLFLVGDPKQSIYLFRQARVERFLRVMREQLLGEVPLEALRLTSNFRSQAALVADFNETFEHLFPAPQDASPTEVPFVPAVAKQSPTGPALHWRTAILGEEKYDADLRLTGDISHDHRLQEARDLVRTIEEFLAQPLPPYRRLRADGTPEPWRAAVLARNRNHLQAVVSELDRLGLPYRAVEIDALNERPEVLDALALTRALLHPSDRTAWLAVLHAPWCGLGLSDLLMLIGEGEGAKPTAPVGMLVQARRSLLSQEAHYRLDRVWAVLQTAVATLGRTPLAVHVERTWRSLGGDAWLTAEQQTNVLRYLDVLQAVETEDFGRISLDVLTARVSKLYAEPRACETQIELLTIHKAKGLEWDLVLVPGLERRPASSDGVLLNWLEVDDEGEPALLLSPIQARGDAADPLNEWLRSMRSHRERAEERRLVYVAATRAREQLHLFGAVKRSSGSALARPWPSSLLAACWPAAQTAFAEPGPGLTAALAQPDAEPFEHVPLAFAASATPARPPTLLRLPRDFDPMQRFKQAERLPYAPADSLRRSNRFDRPEGGFAARAFGNVVHRYLQLLADRLASGTDANGLLAELSTWVGRLTSSLRSEGLAPAVASREATRARNALIGTLSDPVGRWILSPHTAATSEQALATPQGSLRADRAFRAGAAPGNAGDDHLWIVDFKTTEQGSRSDGDFAAAEKQRYSAQLETYATLRRSLPDAGAPIHLALYYPLIPKMIEWISQP